MNMYELMNVQAVKVNNGSGVIIGALSSDYSYILTASHVITDSQDLKIRNYKGEEILAIDVHHHADTKVDCAIIRIPYLHEVALSLYIGERLPHQAQLMMVGYPSTREKELDYHKKVKQQDASFTSSVSGEIIITAAGMPDKDLIDGFSGSGVYYLFNGHPYLVGVEHKMDGAKAAEYFGRITCHETSRYDEVIATHSIAPIMPSFLSCFSSIRSSTFNYDVDDEDIIRQVNTDLQSIIDEIIEADLIIPKAILDRYKNALLFTQENTSSLLDFRLWVSYLEFMVISVLLDNPDKVDEEYFYGLEKKRRLVFSKSEINWISELKNLLELAGESLDEGGSLFVNNCEAAPTAQPKEFQIQRIIPNIAIPRRRTQQLKISQVTNDRFTTYKLAHIRAMHRLCVKERLDEFFKESDTSRHLEMLRGFYNAYVN